MIYFRFYSVVKIFKYYFCWITVMNVTGHLAIATGCYLLINKTGLVHSSMDDYFSFFGGLIACLFGSLLPDIDHTKSTFGSKVKFISYPLSAIFGHRGITHSLFAILSMSYYVYHLSNTVELHPILNWSFISIIIGYLSHVFIDFFSPQGIQLFYPFKRNFRFVIYKTGTQQFIIYFIFLSFSVWYYFN